MLAYGSHRAHKTCNAATPSELKPGLTLSRLEKLRRRRPPLVSRVSASASSATTNAVRPRWRGAPLPSPAAEPVSAAEDPNVWLSMRE